MSSARNGYTRRKSTAARIPPRKRLKSTEEDRISSLPEAQILHILSFLPTKDKIRTGSLSTRWRHLWTRVPKLQFRMFSYDSDSDQFIRNVNQTLLILCSDGGSKLKDFEVSMYYDHRHKSDVTVLTSFASRIGCERFVLELPTMSLNHDDYYTLPQLLYTNSSFKELTFKYCSVVPRGTVYWKSLKELTILMGSFGNDAFEKILSGSPALEILDLSLESGVYHFRFGNSGVKKFSVYVESGSELVVSAPNVESLRVTGVFQTCTLLDMTSLVEAILGDSFTDECSVLSRQLLRSLAHVETLTLHTWVIQGIPMLLADTVLPSLSKCKCLTIDTHLWKTDPSAIASLLNITPGIETLVVKTNNISSYELSQDDPSQHDNSNIEQYWTSQEAAASGFLKHLRIAKFDNFGAYGTHTFSFVRLVLKNAKVLEKMIINLGTAGNCTSVVPMKVFGTLQKLTSFPRSSPNAELLVYP